jgi:hypothetical protein
MITFDFNNRALNLSLDQFAKAIKAKNNPSSQLRADDAQQQIKLYKNICEILGGYESDSVASRVISFHQSNETILPVVEITLPHGAGKIVMRDNFYDTKISFELNQPLPKDSFGRVGYCDPAQKNGYCEGFPAKRIYGSFKKNQTKFTLETGSLASLTPQGLVCQVNELIEQRALEQKQKLAAKSPSPCK